MDSVLGGSMWDLAVNSEWDSVAFRASDST